MSTITTLELIKDHCPHKAFSESTYEKNFRGTYDKIIENLGGSVTDIDKIKFDPYKHLKYYSSDPTEKHKFNATRRLTMEELGLTNKKQISSIGVTDPFPLFTEEAVQIMRKEILNKETFLKYARTLFNSTSGLDCSIRGYAKNGDNVETPFIYDAWTHPKTLELISIMAGVELEIIMDYEIGSINIGMNPEGAEESSTSGKDMRAIVDWHYDSYPFVCVLMLSDTTNMVGGETSLRMGKVGDEPQKIAAVPGPQSGNAAMLQGRLIEHIAPSPEGATERITMVTSFRAKNPLTTEDSILATVKPEVSFGSRYNQFYPQWIKYRSEIIKQRLNHLNDKIEEESKEGKIFDKEGSMEYLKSIDEYLSRTFKEMEVN